MAKPTLSSYIRENLEDIGRKKKRKHLRKIYEEKNPRGPAFNLVIDNSTFDIEQISDQIIFAMEQKNLLKAAR